MSTTKIRDDCLAIGFELSFQRLKRAKRRSAMDLVHGGELKVGCGVVDDSGHGVSVLMCPLRILMNAQ